MLGSEDEINKGGFVLLFTRCSGDKYYWPSTEEKYTVPEDEIMCRISEALQPISRHHFQVIISSNKRYDGKMVKIFNT